MKGTRRARQVGLTGVAIAALLLSLDGIRPTPGLAQQAAQPASTAPADQLLKAEEIEALVAPIALYPDTLLSQVLIASTYPLEVVQAERWLSENKKLKGDALKVAIDKQQWDDSVKALAATPDVLSMMNSKLDWTKKLGDAVLAQQPDVMDAIQRLRGKAKANNKLESTKEQKVTVQQQQGREVVVIEPTEPNTVYVPYYDPAVVYGDWPYADYPAYDFPPPPYLAGGLIATGIAFGAGYALGRWASGANFWGGGINWGNRNIAVNRPVNINNIGNTWQHNPAHRQGVKYSNANVQQRFGGNQRAGAQDRTDFRGRSGEQVLKPGGADRGDRPGAADRAGAGDRPGADQRAGAGDRAGSKGGDRAGSKGGDRASAQRPSGDRGKADRPSGGKGQAASRPKGESRPQPRREAALNVSSGRSANMASQRGHASVGARPMPSGGAMRGGGGGAMRGGGGGRRSDAALKQDVRLLGEIGSHVGFYRFRYYGDERVYVGVLAQEVQSVRPDAVRRGDDGYLRVSYQQLGVSFETYESWLAHGARVPHLSRH